jgi:cyclic beta-1,2-glucan synthetase
MRLLSAVEWADFFESVSLVEEALREGTSVAEMDFPTRDRYRRAIEELARGTRFSEVEVTRRAVRRAREAQARSADDPSVADPGYYLISRGRGELETELGYRVPVGQWLRRAWIRHATVGYIGTTLLLTAVILACPVTVAFLLGTREPWLWLLALLAVVPASELAIAVVNPRRRTDPSWQRERDRGADRDPRGSLSRVRRGRPAFRPSVRLDGRGGGDPPGG